MIICLKSLLKEAGKKVVFPELRFHQRVERFFPSAWAANGWSACSLSEAPFGRHSEITGVLGACGAAYSQKTILRDSIRKVKHTRISRILGSYNFKQKIVVGERYI